MAGSRLLKAVHIVGYFTSLIVLVELAGIGYLSWALWSKAESTRERLREESRTHDGPLRGDGRWEATSANALRLVRSPSGKSDDALSYVFDPAFSPGYSATIQLPQGANVAQGAMVSIEHHNRTRQTTYSQVQTFTVPKADYLAAARRIDTLTDGWPGSELNGCYDGVGVAFERTKAGRTSSGQGNAACDPHYAAVDKVIESLLGRYGPPPAKRAPSPVADTGPVAPEAVRPAMPKGD